MKSIPESTSSYCEQNSYHRQFQLRRVFRLVMCDVPQSCCSPEDNIYIYIFFAIGVIYPQLYA